MEMVLSSGDLLSPGGRRSDHLLHRISPPGRNGGDLLWRAAVRAGVWARLRPGGHPHTGQVKTEHLQIIKVMNFSGAFCPSDYSAGSPCRSLKKSLSLQFPRPFRLSVSRSLNFSLFQQQSATRSPGIQEHKQEEEEEEEEDYDWGERQQTTMQLVEGTYGLFLILLVFACLYLPAYSLTKNKKQGKIRKAIS